MQKQAARSRTHLEEAIALLIHTQATFVSQLAESSRENEKRFSEMQKEFHEIRKHLFSIEAVLLRHERILTDLPEALRQKIGFQPS